VKVFCSIFVQRLRNSNIRGSCQLLLPSFCNNASVQQGQSKRFCGNIGDWSRYFWAPHYQGAFQVVLSLLVGINKPLPQRSTQRKSAWSGDPIATLIPKVFPFWSGWSGWLSLHLINHFHSIDLADNFSVTKYMALPPCGEVWPVFLASYPHSRQIPRGVILEALNFLD
jgi:hypothetical protein